MKTVEALKAFFESDPHGRKVTMDELKALTKEERAELAQMAADELGVELTIAAA